MHSPCLFQWVVIIYLALGQYLVSFLLLLQNTPIQRHYSLHLKTLLFCSSTITFTCFLLQQSCSFSDARHLLLLLLTHPFLAFAPVLRLNSPQSLHWPLHCRFGVSLHPKTGTRSAVQGLFFSEASRLRCPPFLLGNLTPSILSPLTRISTLTFTKWKAPLLWLTLLLGRQRLSSLVIWSDPWTFSSFLFSSPSWGLSLIHKNTALSPAVTGSAPGRLYSLYFKDSSSLWKERVGEGYSKRFQPCVDCSPDRLQLWVESLEGAVPA